MKVTISAVSEGEPPFVIFDSELGGGRARWMVGKPRLGTTYDVELGMPVLGWGEQIFLSDWTRPRITVANDQLLITLQIERLDVDGVLELRLGESVVLTETTGVPAEPGTWIDVRPPVLDLYDTNT
jgi:hypothetical protein